MKKTQKTVMTALMFSAALNMIPAGAVNGINSFASDYNPAEAEDVPVYGPPVSWTTAGTEEVTTQTTAEPVITTAMTTQEAVPVPVYGPPISWTTTGAEMTTQTTTMTEPVPQPEYGAPVAWVDGDINADGRIDVFDMIELRKAFINGGSPDLLRGDVNHDGKIGMADLVMLNNYLLGKTDGFNEPLPEPETTTAEPQFINTTNTTATTETVPAPVYGPPNFFD